jgi:hypothetical protein
MAGPHALTIAYSELYSELANNPFGMEEAVKDTGYEAVYEVWRATAGALGVDVLLQNILAGYSRPIGSIGVFVPDGTSSTGVLEVMHGVSIYPGVPGQAQDRMKIFASLGDVESVDIATVAFDLKQLSVTPGVHVPGSINRTLQLLAEEPANQMLGPFEATMANTRTTKSRTMAYIPFEMMELVLDARLTARQAYELSVPVLVDRGVEVMCTPLVEFLTLALVQPTDAITSPYPLQQQVGMAAYMPGPAVVSHRREHILYRNLPGLLPSTLAAASDPALLDAARGVRDMVAKSRADRDDRSFSREVAQRPRTVRERLGDGIVDCLLIMCRVGNDESLPATYYEWAARPRGVSEHYVLQQAVDAASATLGVPFFEVTPTQVMSFKNFGFVGAAYHNIGTGMLPFSITHSDATSPHARAMLAADRTRVDAFDLGGDSESGAIAPGDVSRLRNSSGYIPQSWMEARTQLHSSQALMGSLLGVDHPLVGAYDRFLRQYDRLMTRLESEVDQVHGRRLGPSLVTFHIQLMWRNWLVAQLDAAETMWVEPPCVWCGPLYDGGPEQFNVATNVNQRPLATHPPQHPSHRPRRGPSCPSPSRESSSCQNRRSGQRDCPCRCRRPPRRWETGAQPEPRTQVRGQHPVCAECALQGRLRGHRNCRIPAPHGESEWSQWSLVHLLARTWTML